jgi:hypothetical protein
MSLLFNIAVNSAHGNFNFGVWKPHVAVFALSKPRFCRKVNISKSWRFTKYPTKHCLICSKILWSTLPTANHVTPYAKSIINGTNGEFSLCIHTVLQ